MSQIIDRQIVIVSVNLLTLTGVNNPSQVSIPINLRFSANELVVKSIGYRSVDGNADVSDLVQIWCNITNDSLIGSFPNISNLQVQHDDHFCISNTFQSGNFVLQFQRTDVGASYNPQPLISSQAPQRTKGVVVITIEFVKLTKLIDRLL